MIRFKRARSAITGRFVSMLYAKRHPKQTIVETTTVTPITSEEDDEAYKAVEQLFEDQAAEENK